MAKAEKKESSIKQTDSLSKKKKIVLKETEDDIVLTKDFKADSDDFTEEIKRELQKSGVLSKILLPFFVFFAIAIISATATYYYAKPERSIEGTISAEEKIQTPPVVGSGSDEEPISGEPETPAPAPAPVTPSAPVSNSISYTVEEGDTMSGIANKYNMTSAELAQFNGITDVNSLRIGQVLKIPSR
jgi:LysM repeat protein